MTRKIVILFSTCALGLTACVGESSTAAGPGEHADPSTGGIEFGDALPMAARDSNTDDLGTGVSSGGDETARRPENGESLAVAGLSTQMAGIESVAGFQVEETESAAGHAFGGLPTESDSGGVGTAENHGGALVVSEAVGDAGGTEYTAGEDAGTHNQVSAAGVVLDGLYAGEESDLGGEPGSFQDSGGRSGNGGIASHDPEAGGIAQVPHTAGIGADGGGGYNGGVMGPAPVGGLDAEAPSTDGGQPTDAAHSAGELALGDLPADGGTSSGGSMPSDIAGDVCAESCEPIEPVPSEADANGCPVGCQGCFDGTSCQSTDSWWTCGSQQICGWAHVEIHVDMNAFGMAEVPFIQGTFNSWCGDCYNRASDPDGDGIYTFTQYLNPGRHEWKPTVGTWGGAQSDGDANGGNFVFELTPEDVNTGIAIDVGPICFIDGVGTVGACSPELVEPENEPNGCPEDCLGCFDGSHCQATSEWWTCGERTVCGLARVEINADMTDFNLSAAPNIQGNFNEWCGSCFNTAQDPDGDGIYTFLQYLSPGEYEWKPTVGNWGGPVSSAPEACGLFGETDFNYHFNVGDDDVNSLTPVVVGPICFADGIGECGSCGLQEDRPPTSVCADEPGRIEAVTINGTQLTVGGTPIHMKGVAWAPIPRGQGPGGGENIFADAMDTDVQLMKDAGINVVRTYDSIANRDVLDKLWANRIYVLMGVFYGYSETPESAVAKVCAVKDHPAILGWVVGNEWNYTNLHREISFDQALSDVREVIAAIQVNDTSRVVSTVYGAMPPDHVYERLDNVDLWGINHYPGVSFGQFFDEWARLSTRPFYFAEYGAEAYDGRTNAINEAEQASILGQLTEEIHQRSSVTGSGPCVGGVVFEFNDEWWKYAGGGWGVHDTTPSWQNFGYPDPDMHEEWWGLVDIDRNPREAYNTYRDLVPPQ